MIAQAINSVPLPSVVSTDTTANITDAMMIHEKVGIATTLAFLVGAVQVRLINSDRMTEIIGKPSLAYPLSSAIGFSHRLSD